MRRDEVLAKIEDKLPAEAKEKFSQIRERLLEKSKALIGDLDDDEEVSEETFEHLRAVRERIEKHANLIKDYRDRKKEILEKLDSDETSGDTQEELKELWCSSSKEVFCNIFLQFSKLFGNKFFFCHLKTSASGLLSCPVFSLVFQGLPL